MYIVSEKSSDSFARHQAGGKGYNLYRLTQAGLPVPTWIVLGQNFFSRAIQDSQLALTIEEILKNCNGDFKRAEQQIEKLFVGSSFSIELEKILTQAYQHLGDCLISVRSSAIDEDSAGHSFAGQLSSFLYVRGIDHVMLAVKRCFASAYSERSLSYRQHHQLPLTDIKVAVVLQQMILSEKSGVAFTADPVSFRPGQMLINAVYGVGEGIVSGLLDADTYTVRKDDGVILHQDIVVKDKCLTRAPDDNGCIEKEVPVELREVACLSASEVAELAALCQKIEAYYLVPQDIEWAMAEGKFNILQARPITTLVQTDRGIPNLWDNSNIVESYGGLTLPLTFGFARYVYHQVYVQFCEILLIPGARIKEMDFFLRNMLGIFYGRIYYNLLNWYKLTSILPGFKYNRQFMETMMGTNEALSDQIADRIKPPAFQESWRSKIRRLITGIKFFYFHLAIQKIVDDFMSYFYTHYHVYRKLDYASMSADQLLEYYHRLEQVFLTKWKAPIINDFLCMVHFGLLKKLCAAWLPQFGEALQNDLIAGDGNLESAEPTKEIIRLANEVKNNPALLRFITDTPADQCMEALKYSTFESFKQKVDHYFDRFGFRCMSEMKLEQKDLWMEPKNFFVFLKNQLGHSSMSLDDMLNKEHSIRQEAEAKVKNNLSLVKRVIFNWVLHHARKAVRNRENTRFCRTRVYGIVRSIFYNMGRDLAARGVLEHRDDVFYLSLEELTGTVEGTNPIINLKPLVMARKAEYQRFEELEPAPRFMTRGPVYWLNTHGMQEAVEVDDSDLPEGWLKGIPCSPGIVEGRVKVIAGPDDDLSLNGDILVAVRTDPGWVPLYPSASALLVERGGLLSHSAIVAREMGLPAIVSVKNLTKILKTGMKIRMDGEKGTIEILESP